MVAPAEAPRATRTPWYAISLVAFAFFVVMLGNTLPTPLYPHYQQRYGWSVLTITVIFGVYAIAVVGGLMLIGRLSDYVGRRPVLIPGVLLSAGSAALFLAAGGLGFVLAGRVLSGFSAAVFTGTATAALVDLMPERRALATVIAVAANLGGLGAGQLVSGIVADHVSRPLEIPYAVDLGLCVLALLAVVAVPKQRSQRSGRWSPQHFSVPAVVRPAFVPAAIAGSCGFAVFGLYGAVVPGLLAHQFHVTAATVVGVIVFVLMLAALGGQLLTRRVSPSLALRLGCVTLIVGSGLLALSVAVDALAALVVAAPLIGLAEGFVIGAGLADINRLAPAEQRGEVASNYFIVLYVGLALPVIAVGALAGPWGSRTASLVLSVIVAVAVAAVLVGLLRRERASAGTAAIAWSADERRDGRRADPGT